jgi:hypothetical protein
MTPISSNATTGTPAVARYSAALRYELSVRNQAYAKAHGLKHQVSYGSQPVVCYEPDGRTHGNFLPATYRAILANPLWARRLQKAHTSARSALPRNDCGFWSELDSSNSSDALLINVFCCPGVFDDGRVFSLLGLAAGAVPEFGFKARVPLLGGKFDRTEVDMRLGSLLVEAKLTESDFLTGNKAIVESYRDFAEVFDRKVLPKTKDCYLSYQLIRNVLAAQANDCAFCVLCDARRPDLLQAWYEIMRSVLAVELRLRCKVLTWQELAAVLPRVLRRFLEEKYGIAANL